MATLAPGQRSTRRRFFQVTAGLAAIAAVGHRPRPGRAAEGTATLLSVGIAAIPSSPFSWRLVQDTAPAFGTGETLERALGFLYSPNGSLRLTADGSDDPNGSGLVQAGRAAFVPEAIFQRQESMEGGPLSYLRIGLVPPEDADFGAGGDVLFDSDGGTLQFLAPIGRRAIRLFRVDLVPSSEAPLPGGGAPVLLHVLDGQAGVGTSGGGDPTPLSAGQTVIAGSDGPGGPGGLVIRSGVGATLLMAVIGEEVPENGAGSISFALFVCPEADGPCLQSNELFNLQLEGQGMLRTEDDLVSQEADLRWLDLPFGTYNLSMPNDYGMELSPLDVGTIGPPNGNTRVFYPVTLTPENPNVGMTLTRTE